MPPSPTKSLNDHDSKELEKFCKFFMFKSIQTIVQSRLGSRVKTKSKEKRYNDDDGAVCCLFKSMLEIFDSIIKRKSLFL